VALGFVRPAFAQGRVCVTGRLDTTQTAARWSPPLDRLITLHASDLALRDALDRVATMAKLRLSYSAELLPLDHVVCVAADAAPVGRVLADLLHETNLAAVGVGGDQVVLAPRANAASHESAPDMSRTVGVLDRVVVTGSAAGASQRELSVGLDVVDGRQLARDNTNTLSGALDSYVPGVWSWTQSPTSMLSSYASIRGASSFGLSYPKIYIDGIEVANPLLVSRFNAGSIDRIEVIRGPQGSALYGTDAISGVVNIVTRHEGASGDGTRASVRTTAGVSQSAFTHNVLAQDHAVSLVSGSSTRSADLHVSGGSIGAFIPDGYSRDFMASGSARVVGTNSTLAATARFFMEQAGTPNSPLLKPAMRPLETDSIGNGLATQPTDTPQSVRQYTIGTTGTFTPDKRWTHSLVAGIDGYRLANAVTNFTPFPSLADSALRAAEGGADRGTLRASSVLHLATTETSRASLTFSAEHAALRETSIRKSTQFVESGKSGPVPPRTETSDVVTWQNSSGFTTQANAAYDNTFFATGGFRVERDSRLAASKQVVTLPMFGGAAVRDYGPFTFKLRAAYGKGIRPPATLVHSSFWQTLNTAATQAALGPEVQSGTEVGFDMLFRRSLSLQVTRFDQRASGLVQQVAMAADSGYQSRHVTYALEDVGQISNRGWEIAAAESVSRLAVTGALSFVGSRVTKLANGYTGDLRTGDRMLQVPATTMSLNASWTGNRWYASLGGARALDWINYDELAMTQQFTTGSHPAHELLGEQLRQYWRRYNGGLRVRASFSRDIRDMLSLELSGDNLLNFQRGEPDNITVVPGRTIMSGVRVKF
jgi:outer membrane cobalamin receptor